MAQFLDPGHQDRFTLAIATLPETCRRDPDWQATIYLLAGNPALWRMSKGYLDCRKGEFRWRELLRQELITGPIGVLARLAVAIFTGKGDIQVSDLWLNLDSQNFGLAMTAIWRRRPVSSS